MPEQPQLNSRGQAEQLLVEITKGKKVHQYFTEKMEDQILVSGQPIKYWEDKFHITVPTDDISPATARQLDMDLMTLNEEATFLWNTAMTRAQMIKYGGQATFMTKFNDLVNKYKEEKKRLPAKDTLENIVKSTQLNVEAAQAIADIEVRFWKSILDHLGRCQSILKNTVLAISTEMKYLNSERQIDSFERRSRQ